MTKVAIVTGASRGLGRFCAEKLNAEGYRVIGLSRKPVADTAFEMRIANVSDPESISAAIADVRFDPDVFALVNAAGTAAMNLVVMQPAKSVRKVIETNLLGTIFCCQQVAPAMVKRGSGARIVNFSSLGVPLAIKGEAVYVASKAGIEAFSRVFAREMSPHNVTVNVIAPGPIATALIAKVQSAKIDAIVQQQIIQRQAEPADVWNILSLLLSEQGSMITGETIHVGGA